MVCMGNICRSPSAEAVLRHRLQALELAQWVHVDSAGTHAFHLGAAPDSRSVLAARARGYDMDMLRARAVRDEDFERFDLVLAMDQDNLDHLMQRCPAAWQSRVRRLSDYIDPASPWAGVREVPDPYYGGPAGFERVLDLIEAACEGLVQQLQRDLQGQEVREGQEGQEGQQGPQGPQGPQGEGGAPAAGAGGNESPCGS